MGIPKTAQYQYCSGKFKNIRDYAQKKRRVYDIALVLRINVWQISVWYSHVWCQFMYYSFLGRIRFGRYGCPYQRFTKFKHEYLKGELDAAFPNYFITQIKKSLERSNFNSAIVKKYQEQNPVVAPTATNETAEPAGLSPKPTVMKTQMTYKIQGKDVVLLKISDQGTWLYQNMTQELLSNGKYLYRQDLEIETIEENKNMHYVTSVERIGIAKGRQEGRDEGRQEGRQEAEIEMLSIMLKHRFGDLPDTIQNKLKQVGEDQLKKWLINAISAPTLDAVFNDDMTH